jgi:hypothetical protein
MRVAKVIGVLLGFRPPVGDAHADIRLAVRRSAGEQFGVPPLDRDRVQDCTSHRCHNNRGACMKRVTQKRAAANPTRPSRLRLACPDLVADDQAGR